MEIADLCANAWCCGKAHVLRCPSTDRGDMGVLRVFWRMWMQAKRRQVNLQHVYPRNKKKKTTVLGLQQLNQSLFFLLIYHRGWERLSDGWDNQTGSNRGFLCRKAWDVGKGRGSSSCHTEQWCVCGRDSSSCKARTLVTVLWPFWSNINDFRVLRNT